MKPQQDSSLQPAEWYVITDDGRSALRISTGLRVGENETGALVLNDPEPLHCWVGFELADRSTPVMRVLRENLELLLDGALVTKPYPLSYGIALQLPHNELYLGPEIGAARRPGPVLRIRPAPRPDTLPEIQVPEPRAPLAEPDHPRAAIAAAETTAPRASAPGAPASPSPIRRAEVPPAGATPPITQAAVPPAPVRPARRPPPSRPAGDEARAKGLPADLPAPRQPPDWHRLFEDVRQPEPGAAPARTGGSENLFVPGGRTPPKPAPPERSTEPSVGAANAAAARLPAEAPGRPPVTAKPQPRPARGRRHPRTPVRLVTLAMVVVGVAVAAYRYPAELNLDEARIRLEAVTARLVGPDADAPLSPPAAAVAKPGSEDAAARPAESVGDPQTASGGHPVDQQAGGGDPVSPAVTPDPAVERGAADEAGAAAAADAAEASGGFEAAAADRPEPARAGATTPVARQAAEDSRLIRARRLLEEGSITYPPEANAVSLALELLGEQPGHPGALALLGEATNRLLTAAIQAYEGGQEYQARNTLEEIFGFNPDNPRARRLWREWVGRER